MSVSVLVALRDPGDGSRERLWRFVKQRLIAEHPDFEIVVGTDDGQDPFHKTLAYNRAAARAHGDILFVTDTDTWTPPALVDACVAGITRDPQRWWLPYRRKVKLLAADTEAALSQGRDWRFTYEPRARYEKDTTFRGAPPMLMPREMFEAVGGFDERFRGWGSEDVAFVAALEALFGPPMTLDGIAVHLWHPRIGKSGNDLWPGQDSPRANQLLAASYRAARTPRRMREVLAGREGAR